MTRRRPPLRPLLLLLVPLTLLAALPAHAARHEPAAPSPRIRPWVPATFDSLQRWATDARALFRAQTRDEVDSVTIEPFNRVAAVTYRWLEGLGRAHAQEMKAVESAVDSLGFDVEMVGDPKLPHFILCVIRNPYRLTAHPMGYMYWFRGNHIYEQGVEMLGGRDPEMRVWRQGDVDVPYEWGFVDHPRGTGRGSHLFLMQMVADGGFWKPRQYIGKGPDIAHAIETSFADIDGDGLPELIAWSEAPADPLFESCSNCPKRLTEDIYTERATDGFALHDSRMVPGPYSMFVLFIHLLIDHNRDAAARLLTDPAKLEEALGLGWGTRRAPGTWKLEDAEPGHWPRWLQFRFRGPRGDEHFVVWFTQKDGRWIVDRWNHDATPGTAKDGGGR